MRCVSVASKRDLLEGNEGPCDEAGKAFLYVTFHVAMFTGKGGMTSGSGVVYQWFNGVMSF